MLKIQQIETAVNPFYDKSDVLPRPDIANMLFLPQKPYMPLGNLRTQLLYPKDEEGEALSARVSCDGFAAVSTYPNFNMCTKFARHSCFSRCSAFSAVWGTCSAVVLVCVPVLTFTFNAFVRILVVNRVNMLKLQ